LTNLVLFVGQIPEAGLKWRCLYQIFRHRRIKFHWMRCTAILYFQSCYFILILSMSNVMVIIALFRTCICRLSELLSNYMGVSKVSLCDILYLAFIG